MAKQNAPNILLEDFNYFANKTVLQYINKRYNIYDISQQTTDDLRVLKATAILDVIRTPYKDKINLDDDLLSYFMDATYTAELPNDYYHLLNCLCLFKVNNTNKCYDKGTVARFSATRLTADSWSQVVDNYWLRPSYKRPYYYIHNVNTNDPEVPTNPVKDYKDATEGSSKSIKNIGTDKSKQAIANDEIIDLQFIEEVSNPRNPPSIIASREIYALTHYENNFYAWQCRKVENLWSWYQVSDNQTFYFKYQDSRYFIYTNRQIKEYSKLDFVKNITIGTSTRSEEEYQLIEQGQDPFKKIDLNGFINNGSVTYPQRNAQVRYGNASKPLIEIRYGEDHSTFELFKIMVDYIKAPQHIRLTQEQIDKTLDTSQVLEFPDYVCQEIINELVKNIMENISDPRLQTFPVVSQSIANPAQQQAPQEQ